LILPNGYQSMRLGSPIIGRGLCGLLVVLCISACAPGGFNAFQQNLSQVAQEQLKKSLAAHFMAELGKGIGSVMATLAKSGGYLDNPLVRILLPPPLTLVFDVAHNLHANPQATLLEALVNQAAEKAIPSAAPILQAALNNVTPAEARALLDGDSTAATTYLKTKTSAALEEALTSLVSANLVASGAQQVYGELLATYPTQKTGELATTDEKAPDLAHYVTERAVAGLFTALGAQEERIRENLDTVTEGALNGLEKAPRSIASTIP